MPVTSSRLRLSAPHDDLGRPQIRSESRDGHDTTYYVTRDDSWTQVTDESVGTGDGTTTVYSLDQMEVRELEVKVDGVVTSVTLDDTTYVDPNVKNEVKTFSRGQITFATAPSNGSAITASYQYATIGQGTNRLEFDFTDPAQTNPFQADLVFCDTIHLKDGIAVWFNGAKDVRANIYVICPAGGIYKDNNGTGKLAAAETIVSHHVIDHVMDGTCEMGMYFTVESKSLPVPAGYIVRAEVDKGSSTTLRGNFTIEANRQRTVIV